jgi:probable phosphoglycerate mutase
MQLIPTFSQYLGELQGQSLMKIPPDAYKSSSIEQMDAVALRAITWWKSTLLRHIARLPDGDGSEPEHILVVSHGGFIGVLLRSLVGSRHAELSPGVKLAPCLNTAICVIRVEDTKGKVLSYGDVRHLKKEAVQSNADEAA